MKLEIRPAIDSDVKAIEKLLLQAGLPTNIPKEIISEFYIGTEDDKIWACGRLQPIDECVILRSVAINKKIRGRGIGKAFAKNLIDLCREKKIRKVYLATWLAPWFWPMVGFRKILALEIEKQAPKKFRDYFNNLEPPADTELHAMVLEF